MKFQASLIPCPLGKDIVFDALSGADADDRMINPLIGVLTPSDGGEVSGVSALSPVQYSAFDLLFGLRALIDTEADCL